jgi:predicted CXXCH cytochrome family protein
MKKYMGICSSFPGFEFCVFADSKEEALKLALDHFARKLEADMQVLEVKPRTERCDICQHTYTPSEIVKQNGEKLCVYCHQDKYGFIPLSPEDIPF